MRYLQSVLLMLALLPRAVAQDTEAEKLFRDMEKKIKAAKAFRVAVTIETKGKTEDVMGRFKGFLLLTNDNKARLNISGDDFGEIRNWEMVSNGKQLRLRPYDIGVSEVFKEEAKLATPKNLHGHLAARVSDLGVLRNLPRLAAVMIVADGREEKLDIEGFKAGAAEKVGDRDAKVVRYKMNLSGIRGDDTAFTIWIDKETLLPLKRVIGPDRSSAAITESYTEFTLDPKIDPKVFDLTWAPANEAEKLFRDMEEKIKRALVVQVTSDIEIKGKGKAEEVKFKGSLLFTKDNKARLKISGNAMGKEVTMEMISDGKQRKMAESPETIAKADAVPTPTKLHGLLVTRVSGAGPLLSYELVGGQGMAPFHIVCFELGAVEKVGGRDAKAVTYNVVLIGGRSQVTLWIDAETLLPLKRVIVFEGEKAGRITEICNFNLNPKVDAGAFQLPE